MDLQLSDSSSDAADEEFWNLANSSSYEELLNLQITALQEDKGRRRRRGSISGRIYKDRQRPQGHQTLYKDYFAENPVHGEEVFRRRFRMHRPLFLRSLDGVKSHDSYFVQRETWQGDLDYRPCKRVQLLSKLIQVSQELEEKNSKKKFKPHISSSSCVGIDIDTEEEISNLISRPLGKKAEKRKLKETSDQFELIQKLHLEKKKRDEKKLEIMKEKIELDKEKLRVRKAEAESKKFEAEMKIMSMDTSVMNNEQRAYYSKLQLKILQDDI